VSGGSISAVTCSEQGAGYVASPLPGVTIIPDPRETGTAGGKITVNGITRSGQCLALLCLDPGTAAQTSTPTFTFTATVGGGVAATMLMNYTVTGFTVTNKGSSLGNSNTFYATTAAYQSTATAAATNPRTDVNINFNRAARLLGYTNSTGNVLGSATSLTLIDAGWGFQQTPSLYISPNYDSTTLANPGVAVTLAATVGGTNDIWYIQQLSV
jgi:hypothetical protein